MLVMDLKARIKNIHWWIGVISTVILIGKYFGFDITDYIGKDWQTLVGLIFGLLALLGVTVDTSTKGISDITIPTVQASTASINNIVSKDSQGPVIQLYNQGLNSTGELKINDNSINASVQPTDNLNASAKINVDIPVEG